MSSVDVFVVYECVQYTKNDWRNRNQIQTRDGQLVWLTVPVRHQSVAQHFMDTQVTRHDWALKHYHTLRHSLSREIGWGRWHADIQALYEQASAMDYLHEINRLFLNWMIKVLGIRTKVVYLNSYPEFADPTTRLVSILKDQDATHYLSGPAAMDYLDNRQFEAARIDLEYVNYDRLIPRFLTGPAPVKKTSTLQLILEGKYEFKCD